MSARPFDVDLAGLLRVFGGHLYSTPEVFVRELIQNALDAHTMLPAASDRPQIWVEIDEQAGSLCFEDAGIGLDREGLREQLSRIGSSSKREGAPAGVIGQFGIGLLSGFLVADRLVVETKTEAGEALRWEASISGDYRVEPGSRAGRGTRVEVWLREDCRSYLDTAFLRRTLVRYVGYVAAEIELRGPQGSERITSTPPWQLAHDQLAVELAAVEGSEPLGLRSFSCGRSRGVLWLRGTEGGRAPSCAAYLHGVLVDASERSLLPTWATFCGAALDAAELAPTASREAFVRDAAHRELAAAIKAELVAWLVELAQAEVFERFLRRHHRALMAACLDDQALLAALGGELPLVTNEGARTLASVAVDGRIHYTTTQSDFSRLAPLLSARGGLLVDACHVHEPELLAAWSRLHDELSLEHMSFERLGEFAEAAPEHEVRFAPLLRAAAALMRPYEVRIELCRFAPSEVPVLVLADASRLRERGRKLSSEGSGLQRALVAELLAVRESVFTPMYINADNPLISALPELVEPERGARALRMLYFQAVAHTRVVPSMNEARAFTDDFLALLRELGPRVPPPHALN